MGGPLIMDDLLNPTPVGQGLLQAGEELGYASIDPNNYEQIGEYEHTRFMSFSHVHFTVTVLFL